MIFYLDSSALIRWIFKTPGYFSSFDGWQESVSSILLSIECYRTVDRLRLEGRLSDEDTAQVRTQLDIALQSISLVSIDEAVSERAQGSFPTVVKSLDAIHLATALLWKEEKRETLTIVTHDRQLRIAGEALGFRTF